MLKRITIEYCVVDEDCEPLVFDELKPILQQLHDDGGVEIRGMALKDIDKTQIPQPSFWEYMAVPELNGHKPIAIMSLKECGNES